MYQNIISRAENYTSETNLDRSEKSKMLRDRGNKSYSKKEMHAALAFYSQAIVAAPVNSRETALAIGTLHYSVLSTLNLYLIMYYVILFLLHQANIFKLYLQVTDQRLSLRCVIGKNV